MNLAEIVIALVIVGILTGGTVTGGVTAIKKAREAAKAKADYEQMCLELLLDETERRHYNGQ